MTMLPSNHHVERLRPGSSYLRSGQTDPVTKRPLKVGDEVVICEHGSEPDPILLESWRTMLLECPFCFASLSGGSSAGATTSKTIPARPARREVPRSAWAALGALVLLLMLGGGLMLGGAISRPPKVEPAVTVTVIQETILVVATVTPAPTEPQLTLLPTDLPSDPTDTPRPTLKPTSQPLTSVVGSTATVGQTPSANSCPGALPARLAIGDTARVINYQLNVRSGPGTRYSIVRRLDVGRTMRVLDGPVCDDGQLWYFIMSEVIRPRDGSQPYQAEGWLVEESGDTYYLEPAD